MRNHSGMAMNTRAAQREITAARRNENCAVNDGFAAATIVNEICGAGGILFFAAGIYRIIDISKPLGWSLALAAVLILAEIVAGRMRLAFCGGLISLLLSISVFGATLDLTASLPTAALATVAANLIYLARFKASLVLMTTSVALTGVYLGVNDNGLDLASASLMAACLLIAVEIAQPYRKYFRLFRGRRHNPVY